MKVQFRAIPFNKPVMVGKELAYIAEAVESGHLAGDGKFTKLCHRWLEENSGARKVLLTHSCTCDSDTGDGGAPEAV